MPSHEKNMQKNLLCFSRFFWQLQIFYRAQLAIFCFQCFQLFEIVNPCFVTSNNICIYTFSLKQRHIFSIAQCLYLYSFLVICRYTCMLYPSGRNLFKYFQNSLQNEYHPRQRYANSFGNLTNRVSAITLYINILNPFPNFFFTTVVNEWLY